MTSWIADALVVRGFRVDSAIVPTKAPVALEKVLIGAERRDISELRIIPEAAYERGLAKIRTAIAANSQGHFADKRRFCVSARSGGSLIGAVISDPNYQGPPGTNPRSSLIFGGARRGVLAARRRFPTPLSRR